MDNVKTEEKRALAETDEVGKGSGDGSSPIRIRGSVAQQER